MPRNGSGTYTLPAGYLATTGQTITASQHNSPLEDIESALTGSVPVDGSKSMTGNLQFSSKKITGLVAGAAATDSATLQQVQLGAVSWADAGGTVDAITATYSPALTSLAVNGALLAFRAAGANTSTTPTFAPNGLTAKTIVKEGNQALVAGDIPRDGYECLVRRNTDDDVWELLNPANASVPLTGGTMSGTLAMADNTISRPKLLDYGETVNAIGAIGGGTQDIDLESGNVVSATVDTSETTFTFSNPPASGTAGSFTLFLTNGGSQTVNWPASVDWAGASAPSLTSSGVDILTFVTIDAGTTWYGFAAGLDMS